MSQYGANYYEEQKPQHTYAPRPNQTQNHYSTGKSSYDPPPYTEQGYTQGDQYTQPQQYTNCGYDQKYESAANMPQGHAAPQSQYAPEGANASYYNGEPVSEPNDLNGEKGLGSTVVGGAAGGYMGHKMGGGWSTAAGAVIGAVGMNVLSHKMKPKPAPVQQVVAAPQQVQYVAAPGIGMGLLGRRQAVLSSREALLSDRFGRRGGRREGLLGL
ncbi:hypothetical protein N7481_004701 [Penicillium waksmanii]|uniref:uncharacterized protein n=1 Tax=Penicillium waksmanii TaxID=69791 RepID=UPI002546F34F|nr:uncharacterized protein N7481_004701 [Penicillium waksmanii]KAJ5989491.1 hypothetical protein N7481_004701 [Penicillium waksmanii]